MEPATKTITDRIIEGLKQAATELEEFRLQLALGKAEASDKYEDVKKKFHFVVREIKEKLNDGHEKVNELKAKLEELQVQLALGKAETKEVFEEQKKRILKAVHSIETSIQNNPLAQEFQATFSTEIEKFKIKLEILQLRYTLGKIDAKEEFEEKKLDFLDKMEELKKRLSKHEPEVKENLNRFSEDIKDAFSHLKKAFSKG